jgi:hypothetical protein
MSPQKSKKYRRDITPAAAVVASSGATQVSPVAKAAPRNNASYVPLPNAQSFLKDLTWIGLTTLIIVVLMIVAYFVVPR